MRLVNVAAATLNQTPLDWNGNKANILAAIAAARSSGVSILCLPELCITGYGCEDAFLAPATRELALDVLQELLPACADLIVCLGLPLAYNKAVFNASCLVANGEILGFCAKRALAGDGIHYEPRWFKPWPSGTRVTTNVRGRETRLGDVHFDCGGVRIGFEICEDAWIAQRPGAELALDAVDIILNPSASHFSFGKHEIRRRLVLEGARAFGVTYVYSNLLGNEAGRVIYDGDALIASAGTIVAEAGRFGFSSFELVTATIDVDLTRTRYGVLTSFVPHVAPDDACVSSAFHYPELAPGPARRPAQSWEASPALKNEEFARAMALGLFDYLRKTRSAGFVVSLSGGADSSAVCALIWLMACFSWAELGVDGVKRKLAHVPGIDGVQSARDLVGVLLTTVYQATSNSGEVTRRAAREVAAAVGAGHLELDVGDLVHGYEDLVSKALGRTLSWERDDLALQNIQARTRAPSVWMIANLTGKLLLSTSNRSEAAVGYATMDGDTAGGLSPIAGIDKAFIRRFLRWLEREGPAGLAPLPALKFVNDQAPTAELRPAGSLQTDETDLMPYDLLDAIERASIRDKRSPTEVFALMRVEFPAIAPGQLLIWLERFYRLFSRNQWKRERYAPSFHVDDANLDPKTWCRFPILSGGFERELDELRAELRRQGLL
jgi:NAD+ synthase (glutamine-hydrolysing)